MHHIVPRHMGGTNDPANLVELTIEDHAIAHFVLWKMHGRVQDKIAWMGLSNVEKQIWMSELMTENNPMHRPEVKAKHAKSMQSEQRKQKLSAAKKGNRNVRGKSWFNNGVKTGMFHSCPDGWSKGRLNPHWNHKRKKNGTA